MIRDVCDDRLFAERVCGCRCGIEPRGGRAGLTPCAIRTAAAACHAMAPRSDAPDATRAPLVGWRRSLLIVFLVLVWWSASVTVIFAMKHILSARSFKYPFFMTAWTNGIVGLISWLVTRIPKFRQPPLSQRALRRVVLPIGLCTALDIGFSNWSLSLMSVSFHTILKGTIPAFVLVAGWMFKLERFSALKSCSVGLVVIGVGMASAAEVHFSVGGLLLGLMSASMGGTRWALTQLLMRGSQAEPQAPQTPAPAAGGSGGYGGYGDQSGQIGGGSGGNGAGGEDGVAVQQTLSRRTNPLGSMLYISPITATCALIAALCLEVFDAPWLTAGSGTNRSATPLLASPWLRSEALLSQLALFLLVVALLVFLLLLAEFAIVQLTSSLTLSILGILKELLTILLAGGLRGEPLTVVNCAGFGICSFGVLLCARPPPSPPLPCCLRLACCLQETLPLTAYRAPRPSAQTTSSSNERRCCATSGWPSRASASRTASASSRCWTRMCRTPRRCPPPRLQRLKSPSGG